MEKLESEYPELRIETDLNMPKHQGGFIYNKHIVLNANKSYQEQHSALAEEIGHYETSSGSIINLNTPQKRQQEARARRWGYQKVINLDGLVACYRNDMTTTSEVADFFEVTPEYLWKAIDAYRQKYGESFFYFGYKFDFSHGLSITGK